MAVLLPYLLVVLFCSYCSSSTQSGETERQRRFVRGSPPQFLLKDYVVSERDGTLENHVCVLPGSEEYQVRIFSALGPETRCFRFPCPQAQVNVDFRQVELFRVFIKPGKTFCFDITILDDNEMDGREFFLLALQDLRKLEIVDTSVVTINDDDDPSFNPLRSLVVPEDVGNLDVCVVGGNEDVPVVVRVLPESSTASMSSFNPDFAVNFVSGGELLLKAREEVCLSLTVVDDINAEPVETVRIALSQGSNSSAKFYVEEMLYIVDNDVRPSFDSSLAYYREDAGVFEVCVNFTGSASLSVRCQFLTESGTAFGGSDFVPTLSFFNMAGQSRVCHQVELLNDEVPENFERFSLLLQSSNSELPPSRMVVTIADDDFLEFDGSLRTYTVMENDTYLELCVVFSNGNLTSTIRGYLISQAASANTHDFIPVSRLIQLASTDESCFNVTIKDDPFLEPQEEFRVFLFTLSPRNRIVHSDVVTVQIQDDGDEVW